LDCLDLAEGIGDKAVVLRGYAWDQRAALLTAVEEIAAVAPFRNMITPGGFRMSVAMTNCGRAGWVTDRKGYRYDLVDPLTDLEANKPHVKKINKKGRKTKKE